MNGGLNTAVNIVIVGNVGMPMLLAIFNPEYMWRVYKRK
jgi:hypothetical protein